MNWNPIATAYDPLKCGSIDGTDDYPHDKAVLRALSSTYKPNKQVTGDPLCTIFIGKLDPITTEDKLKEVFAEFGGIKRCRLIRDIISGFSKRYAFIEYKSGSSANRAVRHAHQMFIDGSQILVDMELERELPGWIPRRLGGGFGGKKEAGQLRFGGKDRPFRKPINLTEPHGSFEKLETRHTFERDRSESSRRREYRSRSRERVHYGDSRADRDRRDKERKKESYSEGKYYRDYHEQSDRHHKHKHKKSSKHKYHRSNRSRSRS